MAFTQRLRAFVALLLLSASASRVSAAPCSAADWENSEISGDELPEVPQISPSTRWELQTRMLICEVHSLRDQQFVEEFREPVENMTNFKDNSLKLPNIADRDCTFSNFNKETCLLRISSALQEYAVYLQFVSKEYSNQDKVSDIQLRTKFLADHVAELMKQSKRVQELDSHARDQLLSALPAGTAWEKKMTVHVLLREFRSFLTRALRALRRIGDRTRKRDPLRER